MSILFVCLALKDASLRSHVVEPPAFQCVVSHARDMRRHSVLQAHRETCTTRTSVTHAEQNTQGLLPCLLSGCDLLPWPLPSRTAYSLGLSFLFAVSPATPLHSQVLPLLEHEGGRGGPVSLGGPLLLLCLLLWINSS